jgi:hypothetical protein
MAHPDFEDSGAAWEELRADMQKRTAPLQRAAARLYGAGLRGLFIPIPAIGPGTLVIVGRAHHLAALERSPEALRRAFQHDQPLAAWEALVGPVEAALAAGGGAAAAMLPVPEAGPDVRVVVGDLDDFHQIVRSLADEHE